MHFENKTRPWYKDWFDEDYLSLYQHRDEAEAETFLDWLFTVLPDNEQDRHVADIACGAGRHAWIMARKHGLDVTAVDLSFTLLQHALDSRTHSEENTPAFVQGDIRSLPLCGGQFSLVLNMFTSFGYFTDEQDHLTALNELRRILNAKGILILDVLNRQPTVNSLVANETKESGHLTVAIDRWVDEKNQRINKRIVMQREGKQRMVLESVRMFTLAEMEELVSQADLRLETVFGNYEGQPYNEHSSPRMILWMRKP